MMKKICVVFDVDGTLFDTKGGIIKALNYVLGAFHRERIATEDEDKYIGPPIKWSLMEFQGFNEVEAIKATELYRKIYVERFVQESVPYAGMELVLKELNDECLALGIATMKTKPQVDKLIQFAKWHLFFQHIESAREDGTLSKSQMLLNIKNTFPGAEQFLMVGDTQGDYVAACENDYRFVAVDYGYGDIKDLEKTHICKPMELLSKIYDM
jgi:phosphoglycolate phosphatase